MHAVLTPVGSAGDVNPFLVIGRELRRRGHEVTLIASDVFAAAAGRAGLNFVSIWSEADYRRTIDNPDLWHPQRGLAIVLSTIAGQLRRAYSAIAQVYEPDRTVLVGHTLGFFTRVFEEVHRTPAATLHLAPSVFRSDFRQPALPSGRDISRWPRWIKRTLWWGIDRFLIDPQIAPALNGWRAELGLPPVSRVFRSWLHSPQRVIGLFPDWFGGPQPDWPPQLRLTGFALSDAACAPAPVEADPPGWLGEDEAAIVFTPGSANRHAAPFFRAGIEAAAALGRRALLVTPYGEHLPRSLPEHVRHAAYAPFDRLFPRAAAVVHHGGIGTCAQALAAGVPQVIMPLGFDQPDNALRIARLGVGAAIAPSRFTGARVADALQHLLSSRGAAESCRRYAERIGSADAIAQTCDLIEGRA